MRILCIFVLLVRSSMVFGSQPATSSDSGIVVGVAEDDEKGVPSSPAGSGRESSEDSALVAELAATSISAAASTEVINSGRCNESDVNIWKLNTEFTDRHRHCSRTRFGDGPKTSACLLKKYPDLTHTCATCFGDVTECMRSDCWTQCFLNDSSESCMICFDTHCRDGFHGCLGSELLARDPANIPLRPGQIVAAAVGGEAATILTTTTTTESPIFAVRARPRPKITTSTTWSP